jgi:regulator of sigma E protease
VARQPGQGLAVLGAELPNLYLGRVVPGSAADAAGLVAGDRLLALDGQPLASFELLRGKLAALRDKPLRLSWVHQGVEHSAELQQTPVKQKDAYNRDVKALELGVVSAFDTLQGERPGFYAGERTVFDEVRLGPGAALSTAFRRVWETISAVAVSLALLLTGQVPFSNLGGPIMLYGIASQSAQAGLDQFLSIMALISINLGLLNLLPIPVLDGFGLLSAFWEWIRRRPIPMRAREIANMFGLAVLVLLMVAVFKNDITRLLN